VAGLIVGDTPSCRVDVGNHEGEHDLVVAEELEKFKTRIPGLQGFVKAFCDCIICQ